MVSAGQMGHEARPAPRVVIVVGRSAQAGTVYRVEAPDRVLRMFGLLTAARDELDLANLPPEARARLQRLLEIVRAELDRSVSPALADELHRLVFPDEKEPSAAQLRLEYASLLGWASGLVVGMLDLFPKSVFPMSGQNQPAGSQADGSGPRRLPTIALGYPALVDTD